MKLCGLLNAGCVSACFVGQQCQEVKHDIVESRIHIRHAARVPAADADCHDAVRPWRRLASHKKWNDICDHLSQLAAPEPSVVLQAQRLAQELDEGAEDQGIIRYRRSLATANLQRLTTLLTIAFKRRSFFLA